MAKLTRVAMMSALIAAAGSGGPETGMFPDLEALPSDPGASPASGANNPGPSGSDSQTDPTESPAPTPSSPSGNSPPAASFSGGEIPVSWSDSTLKGGAESRPISTLVGSAGYIPMGTTDVPPISISLISMMPPIADSSNKRTIATSGSTKAITTGLYAGGLNSGGSRPTARFIVDRGSFDDGDVSPVITAYIKFGEEVGAEGPGLNFQTSGSPHNDDLNTGSNYHINFPWNGEGHNVIIESDHRDLEFDNIEPGTRGVPVPNFEVGPLTEGRVIGVKIYNRLNEDGSRTITTWVDLSADQNDGVPTGDWKEWLKFTDDGTLSPLTSQAAVNDRGGNGEKPLGNSWQTWIRADGHAFEIHDFTIYDAHGGPGYVPTATASGTPSGTPGT
jgi:hypothetical protein